MGFYAENSDVNMAVTDMALQFSSARQSELFQLFQSGGNFFFYLALTFALIGGIILLIRPSLWRPQPILSYLFILFIVLISSTNGDSLFFNKISFGDNYKQESIFAPQAVVLDVGSKVSKQLGTIFHNTSSKQNVKILSTIENLRINNLTRQLEMRYYEEICKPVGGDDIAKYVGTNTHLLAQTEGGRVFANRMAHSYFNLKHVYKLNDYYYNQAEINPLITTAIPPVYATLITNLQNAKKIEKHLDKRMRDYISSEDIEKLGWHKKNIWLKEAEGITATVEQVENILELPKALPIPPFMINEPLQGTSNNAVVFRRSIEPYITPYGFVKQMEYPAVIEFAEEDVVLNCLDFHERTVNKLVEDFKNSSFVTSHTIDTVASNFHDMLPPSMQPEALNILTDKIIIPRLGQKMYRVDSFPKAEFSDKLSQLFPYVQSLLLGIFLFVTPLILLIGLLIPFWGLGILAMLILGVAWLELWQLFLIIGSGVYNHIAPFMLADITLESFVSVYVYGVAVVHGIVSVFAILLLPSLIKSLPFTLSEKTTSWFGSKEKPNVVTQQLESVLQKFKEHLPERIRDALPATQNQSHIKQNSIHNNNMTKTAIERMRESSRVQSQASAMENKYSPSTNQNTSQSVPNSPVVAGYAGGSSGGEGGGASGSGGNAYGMFQKVVQENYMTLGHDAVNALQMTEKHMQHMTSDDMRSGEAGGRSYVEVRQSALGGKVSGGEKSDEGYVRFYQKKD